MAGEGFWARPRPLMVQTRLGSTKDAMLSCRCVKTGPHPPIALPAGVCGACTGTLIPFKMANTELVSQQQGCPASSGQGSARRQHEHHVESLTLQV